MTTLYLLVKFTIHQFTKEILLSFISDVLSSIVPFVCIIFAITKTLFKATILHFRIIKFTLNFTLFWWIYIINYLKHIELALNLHNAKIAKACMWFVALPIRHAGKWNICFSNYSRNNSLQFFSIPVKFIKRKSRDTKKIRNTIENWWWLPLFPCNSTQNFQVTFCSSGVFFKLP